MKVGVRKPEKEKDGEEEKENHGSFEDEVADGNSSNTDCDQDRDVSFMNGTQLTSKKKGGLNTHRETQL